MVRRVGAVFLFVVAVLVPATSQAQASIAGVVKDGSGGVLPGVTVEAASPALIEKVRSVTTDGTGQYRLVDLRPGTYVVTFTLPGFSTVRREDLELTGSFTASVNAELKVGTVQETITVTGETPIVDVQNAKRQQVLSGELVKALPAARGPGAIAILVPGITETSIQDVQLTPGMIGIGIHGGPIQEGRVQVDGLNVGASRGGAGYGGYRVDTGNSQEVTFSTSGGLGESETGGVYMNIVPRTGGNTVKGSFFYGFSNRSLQGSNYTQALQDAGLRAPGALLKLWDISGAVGGPIKKDRLWYFVNVRDDGLGRSVPGMYANLNAEKAGAWTYLPDLTRQARTDSSTTSTAARLTWQITPRNKLNLFWDEQRFCNGAVWTAEAPGCRHTDAGWIQGGSATSAPETATYLNPPQRVQQVTWTSPVSSRILVEGGYGNYLNRWGGWAPPGSNTRDLVRVTEQAGSIPGLTYRSADGSTGWISANTWRATVSYVTGANNLKFGYNGAFHLDNQDSNFTNTQYLAFRLNNGVPNQLTMTSGRFDSLWRTRYHAVYVQDQSTFGRLTVQGAVRYEHAWSYFPQQQLGGTRFIPTPIVFPETQGVTGFDDVNPRVGAAYDLFGNGKTSLKMNLGRYLEPAQNGGRYTATSPTSRVATSTSRSWTDANRDFVPDCDLMNPVAQDLRGSGGDVCGAFSNNNFGTSTFGIGYDPALLEGWGVRPWDWQIGAAVQHQLLPRVSAEVQYNRRWWNGFTVVDNLAVGASSFTPYSVFAPVDSRLPGGGGYEISGLYDVDPAQFGKVDYYVTDARNFGEQSQYWQGVDINVSVRARGGVSFQGGTSTGQSVADFCQVASKVPESLAPAQTITIGVSLPGPTALGIAQAGSMPAQYCHLASGFLTQFRGLGTFTIPKIDVQMSATFQSKPGIQLAANYNVPSAVVQQTLGRAPAGGVANVTVNLVTPGTLYGNRVNDLDFRLAKIVKFGRTRTNVGLDLYNVLNSAAVLSYNQTYSPASTAWLTPTGVLSARLAKFSVQFDF